MGKRVEFTHDFVTIYDMLDNSTICVGEVNHQSHLYHFSKFNDKYYYALLLAHVERFGITMQIIVDYGMRDSVI
jgi:hypothetical protein